MECRVDATVVVAARRQRHSSLTGQAVSWPRRLEYRTANLAPAGWVLPAPAPALGRAGVMVGKWPPRPRVPAALPAHMVDISPPALKE